MLTSRTDWPADPSFAATFAALEPHNLLGVLRSQLVREDAERRDSWTSCRVIEALYDPGEHVRVAYVLTNNDRLNPQRAWPEGDIVYLRYPVRNPMSRRGTLIRVGDCELEAYRFPNDRRLRGLRKFARRDSAAESWQRWLRQDEPAIDLQTDTLRRGLMRYVPEQKWIIHLRAKCHDSLSEQAGKRAVAVRSADVSVCKAIYDRTVGLAAALHGVDEAFRIPRPVALDTRLGLLAVKWAWGRTLLEMLQSTPPNEVMSRVAVGLHAFHQARVGWLTEITVDDQLESAGQCARDIGIVLPELSPLIESVLAGLSRDRPERGGARATVHNDFHWNQLRIKRDRMTVMDLERCGIGDPLIDVATFVTQISMLAVRGDIAVTIDQAAKWKQAFVEAWESVTGSPIDDGRVRWYSTIALLTLARGMIRHLRPGWPELARMFVERAGKLAQGRNAEDELGGGIREVVA